jgi:non-specific serine/threonine protein kinase/serine/threonine-protein kinase
VLQRFYSERQSLAIMEHPSIAKVFDAGATPDGQPYFVMEYVSGLPITDYCDRKRLKIGERLELFVKVCEGVQHAHQKAVMHRDLKPANILVVEVDGKPVPRIIDFGLAKAATSQLDGETLLTQAGGWVGTPGYMSPEQADPYVMDVDTRTDVYSLGAVLYVLLTGFLPFETEDWRKQRLDEFLRRLREDDPPWPSAKVGTEKESSKASAEARGAEPKQLVNLLHGDLDWITMKALEKDRGRRYATPTEFAADLGRFLRNEPVLARAPTAAYRLRKLAQRNKALAYLIHDV